MNDWRRSFYALFVAQWLSIIGFNFVMPFMPLFVQELGVTDLREVEMWSGGLSASMGFALAIFSPIWGVLADRHGRKPMVQRAMFGGALVLAAMALSRDVHDLLVLRILQGVLTGTVSASVALAVTISPRHLMGRNLGLMQTAVFSGNSLGPLIGGFLADQTGYRPVFIITGVVLFLGGLVVTFMVTERFTPRVGPSPVNLRGFGRDLWQGIASPALLAMNIVLLALNGAAAMIFPVLPLFVQEIGHATNIATAAGFVMGAMAVSSAVSSALVGRHSDRLGYQRVLVYCALGAGLLSIPQAFAADIGQLIALRFAQGIFMGGIVPTANAIIVVHTPSERRGSAFGITASATSLGFAIGPLAGAPSPRVLACPRPSSPPGLCLF